MMVYRGGREPFHADPWSNLPDDGRDLATSDFVTARINRISRIFNKTAFRPYSDIGVLEWRVLSHVTQISPYSARAITDEMTVDKGAVSRTLRRLELAGLITVTDDPQDGRASVISITPAGCITYARLLHHARQRQVLLLKDMSPEERRDLWFLLEKLTQTARSLIETK